MNVLVSGANGFVGRHVCKALHSQQHKVFGLTRHISSLHSRNVHWIEHDLSQGKPIDKLESLHIDAVIHLAWQELDNYQSENHSRHYIDMHFNWLSSLIKAGVLNIQVIGTCLEYGLVEGEIDESTIPIPVTEYGKAKHNLRIKLEAFSERYKFKLQWVRLFYLYGEGQRESSFIPLLQSAIHSKQDSFAMSGGAQVRDYLDVKVVANCLSKLLVCDQSGSFNCASNKPISMKNLATNYIKAAGAEITLNLGVYPYSPFEPMSFWGSNKKILDVLGVEDINWHK